MNPDSLPSFDEWRKEARRLQYENDMAWGVLMIAQPGEEEAYRAKRFEAKDALLAHLRAHPSAAPQGAQPAERSPKDYAIEHAEYMAQSAEHLLSMIEALSAAELHREETGEDDGAVHDARDVVWESVRGLHSHIYEFRKRKDRAAASPADAAPVPQEVREALQEIRDLVWSGKVRYVEHLGGGIWTWPDRAEAALNAGLTIPAPKEQTNA